MVSNAIHFDIYPPENALYRRECRFSARSLQDQGVRSAGKPEEIDSTQTPVNPKDPPTVPPKSHAIASAMPSYDDMDL
jgi:hypothetical protein